MPLLLALFRLQCCWTQARASEKGRKSSVFAEPFFSQPSQSGIDTQPLPRYTSFGLPGMLPGRCPLLLHSCHFPTLQTEQPSKHTTLRMRQEVPLPLTEPAAPLALHPLLARHLDARAAEAWGERASRFTRRHINETQRKRNFSSSSVSPRLPLLPPRCGRPAPAPPSPSFPGAASCPRRTGVPGPSIRVRATPTHFGRRPRPNHLALLLSLLLRRPAQRRLPVPAMASSSRRPRNAPLRKNKAAARQGPRGEQHRQWLLYHREEVAVRLVLVLSQLVLLLLPSHGRFLPAR